MKAHEILTQAGSEMDNRAVTYDQPQGERSMAKTIAMFNTLTGKNLTETEGWHFMSCLKMARSTQGEYRPDNHIDHAAYAALAGESASRADQKPDPETDPATEETYTWRTDTAIVDPA